MKFLAKLSIAAAAVMAIAGCSPTLNSASTVSANVAASTPAVVMDLTVAGALTNVIAAQIAAANPNNAKIQAAVAKIEAGTAITTADAAALAPAIQLINGGIQVVAAEAAAQ